MQSFRVSGKAALMAPRKPLRPINAGNQNVFHVAILELCEHVQQNLSPLFSDNQGPNSSVGLSSMPTLERNRWAFFAENGLPINFLLRVENFVEYDFANSCAFIFFSHKVVVV